MSADQVLDELLLIYRDSPLTLEILRKAYLAGMDRAIKVMQGLDEGDNEGWKDQPLPEKLSV